MAIPKHLAIIPDGNRRCARRLMKKPWKGHAWGIEKIKQVFEWAKGLGIKVMTFYTLSLENLNRRPKTELNFLFKLAKKEIKNIINDKNSFVHQNKVRMTYFGNTEKLPDDLQEGLKELDEATKNYSDHYINLAIAYGGRQEILTTCQKICTEVLQGRVNPEKVDDLMFRHHLQTNGHPDPDMIIRTGGEVRLSNFLLYQSAYAELFFLDTFWPDLKKDEFVGVVREFGERQRRFGK